MRLRAGFHLLLFISILLLPALLFSTSQLNTVAAAVSQFCAGITSLLPSAAMFMVLVGAVVYAAGQVMGAETRARANVWATAALTGALVGMLIASVAPSTLSLIYGENSINCQGAVPTPPPPLLTCGSCTYYAADATCCGAAPHYLCPTTTFGCGVGTPMCLDAGGGSTIGGTVC